jgi:tetratricopeptide (TPR) repeat protein
MGVDRDDFALSAYTKGREALREGRTAEAVELLRASVTRSPHFKTLELLGEALVGLGMYADGIVCLAASVGLGHKQSRPRFLLAKALAETGQQREALPLLDEALALNPQYASAKELRAQIVDAGISVDD